MCGTWPTTLTQALKLARKKPKLQNVFLLIFIADAGRKIVYIIVYNIYNFS